MQYVNGNRNIVHGEGFVFFTKIRSVFHNNSAIPFLPLVARIYLCRALFGIPHITDYFHSLLPLISRLINWFLDWLIDWLMILSDWLMPTVYAYHQRYTPITCNGIHWYKCNDIHPFLYYILKGSVTVYALIEKLIYIHNYFFLSAYTVTLNTVTIIKCHVYRWRYTVYGIRYVAVKCITIAYATLF